MDTHPRPLEGPGIARRVAPFAGAATLALTTIPIPPGGNLGLGLLAAGLTALLVAAALLYPWERLPTWCQAVPALGYFAVIALLRHSEGGGTSGYGPLVLIPIFWLALHGTKQDLWISFGLTALVFVLPIVLLGDPEYPVTEWRRALVWMSIAPLVGLSVQSLVSHTRDLAAQSALEARTDPLTGLPNRRTWDESLGRELSRARRTGRRLSVALLDLDRFKAYNDTYGHQAGDLLLKEAAATWKTRTRETDLLARYGGEEFVLLMPETDAAFALVVVERLRAATPRGQTCSAGVASWDRLETAEELVARADKALYLAKDGGRDRCVGATFPLG